MSAATTYTLVKYLWATTGTRWCKEIIRSALIAQATPAWSINSPFVWSFARIYQQKFKMPPARNPATSIPRAIMSPFRILLIFFSKYFSVQLFQPHCLLCSQQLVYNINTSLMLRHFRANHETLLPRLNQAEAGRGTLNYFWGNLPWGVWFAVFIYLFILNSSETVLLCAVGTRTKQEISLPCFSLRWKLYDLGCLSLKPMFVGALEKGSPEEPRLACRGQWQWI